MQSRRFDSFVATVALLLVTTPAAWAERRTRGGSFTSPARFGVELELGAPSGLSGKYFLGGTAAIQGGMHLGVRAPLGVSFLFRKTPMDIFVELALVVDLVHLDSDDRYDQDHDHAGLNGALGARYYF